MKNLALLKQQFSAAMAVEKGRAEPLRRGVPSAWDKTGPLSQPLELLA
jgi:hypothetical protein